MLEVVTLTRSDCALLAARYGEHGNSHRRMLGALEEAAAAAAFSRACVLRQLEKRVGVDLGMLCYRFEHRADQHTHPIERSVLEYVAHWRGRGEQELLITVVPDSGTGELAGLMGTMTIITFHPNQTLAQSLMGLLGH